MPEEKDWWDKLNLLSTLAIAAMVAYWGFVNDSRQQDSQQKHNMAILELQKQQQEAEKKYNEAVIKLDAQKAEYDRQQNELNNHFNTMRLDLDSLKVKAEFLNKDEDQLTHRLAVISTLMPHISESEQSRKIAIIALSKLGSEDIAMEFASVYEDSSAKAAGDEIQNNGVSKEQGADPIPAAQNLSFDPLNIKSGWMYLGRKEGAAWSGNYTELDNSDSVEDLVGKIVSVKEGVPGVNIRTGFPSIFGKLRPTLYKLKPGSKVRIGNKRHYTFNDFVWVSVEFSPPKS